jgi:formylglycine-generating enzyme required for sulfatase activity
MKMAFTLVMVIVLLGIGEICQALPFIETVSVGNTGNVGDTLVVSDGTTGYGSVSYTYNIGKYEVTTGQYTAFLNAVAPTDTHELYNTEMGSAYLGCNITRSGSPGSYTYTVGNGSPADTIIWANRPVNYVSFWDACRFANWLSNGQPTGLQDSSTTEDGTYTLTVNGITNNTITRNPGSVWAVANENEWYKAAYYDPNKPKPGGGTEAGYWLYPTMSDDTPGRDMTDLSGNNANHNPSDPYPIDGSFTTLAGEFQNSDSPFGTFDQGGNVWEWNESIGVVQPEFYRGMRGGSLYDKPDTGYLQAWTRNFWPTWSENWLIGFRVVQLQSSPSTVPEPATLLGFGLPMLMVGLGKLRGLRK